MLSAKFTIKFHLVTISVVAYWGEFFSTISHLMMRLLFGWSLLEGRSSAARNSFYLPGYCRNLLKLLKGSC